MSERFVSWIDRRGRLHVLDTVPIDFGGFEAPHIERPDDHFARYYGADGVIDCMFPDCAMTHGANANRDSNRA